MDGFLGEIRMFAGNYAPEGWALCDGSHLPISGNEALYSLLGTVYGGDGARDFALPDLRGRVPLSKGQGPGLSARALGASFGEEAHTLRVPEMPQHTHVLSAGAAATATVPENLIAGTVSGFNLYKPVSSTPETLAADSLTAAGGGQAHPNMMPTVCISFIINLRGLYPQQN